MRQFSWILLIVFFILGDQWTKNLAVNNLELYQRVNVTSFLDITLLYNTVAARLAASAISASSGADKTEARAIRPA